VRVPTLAEVSRRSIEGATDPRRTGCPQRCGPPTPPGSRPGRSVPHPCRSPRSSLGPESSSTTCMPPSTPISTMLGVSGCFRQKVRLPDRKRCMPRSRNARQARPRSCTSLLLAHASGHGPGAAAQGVDQSAGPSPARRMVRPAGSPALLCLRDKHVARRTGEPRKARAAGAARSLATTLFGCKPQRWKQ
jgi:hypothetical protein